jgi:6-phosphogluconolactonase
MVWPLDVVVMGMGEDGHVASLFPGDETGFAPRARRFVAITGPGDEPRVSLSAQSLVRARKAYLLFRGAAKLATLSNALRGSLPVARVLDARRAKVHVFVGD